MSIGSLKNHADSMVKFLILFLQKNLFCSHRTTYANKKDIRPEKPDFIGLFHVS